MASVKNAVDNPAAAATGGGTPTTTSIHQAHTPKNADCIMPITVYFTPGYILKQRRESLGSHKITRLEQSSRRLLREFVQ